VSNFQHRKHKDSLVSAFRGVFTAFATQPNFKIMFCAVFCVVSAGIIFKLNSSEWLTISLIVAVVFIAEMINTSIEAIVDLVTDEWRKNAKIAKDVAGGMVLLTVIFAVIIGTIIFFPKLILLIK
jgi:diacylglycerol kinase